MEEKERYRLQHAIQNPETSQFRVSRSIDVIKRNRYANVQPWDALRVKLKQSIDGSDYVNASPILLTSDVPALGGEGRTTVQVPIRRLERSYIATQGPMESTRLHFWQMVLQESSGDVGVVIMLTRLFESSRDKCSQYFPGDMENPTMTISTLTPEEEVSSTEGFDSDEDEKVVHESTSPHRNISGNIFSIELSPF